MDSLAVALGPVFATGFAAQQFLEILEQVLFVVFPFVFWGLTWVRAKFKRDVDGTKSKADKIKGNADKIKKAVLGIFSLIIGLLLAWKAGLRVLQPLGIKNTGSLDIFVTGLIISAGTEGVNSIMKFLGYSKEKKKGEAKPNGKATSQQETAE